MGLGHLLAASDLVQFHILLVLQLVFNMEVRPFCVTDHEELVAGRSVSLGHLGQRHHLLVPEGPARGLL